MTHQTAFAHAEFAAKKKTTRREKFLARMEEVIPWARLLAVLQPHYPTGQRKRVEKGPVIDIGHSRVNCHLFHEVPRASLQPEPA